VGHPRVFLTVIFSLLMKLSSKVWKMLGYWGNFLITLTGIRSNRWNSLFILIGSGNLYPVLHDPVVVLDGLPDIFFKASSEHNLETSSL
jgi:hypothetical protein